MLSSRQEEQADPNQQATQSYTCETRTLILRLRLEYFLSYEVLELLQISIRNILEHSLQNVIILYDKIKKYIFGILAIIKSVFKIFLQMMGKMTKNENEVFNVILKKSSNMA